MSCVLAPQTSGSYRRGRLDASTNRASGLSLAATHSANTGNSCFDHGRFRTGLNCSQVWNQNSGSALLSAGIVLSQSPGHERPKIDEVIPLLPAACAMPSIWKYLSRYVFPIGLGPIAFQNGTAALFSGVTPSLPRWLSAAT